MKNLKQFVKERQKARRAAQRREAERRRQEATLVMLASVGQAVQHLH